MCVWVWEASSSWDLCSDNRGLLWSIILGLLILGKNRAPSRFSWRRKSKKLLRFGLLTHRIWEPSLLKKTFISILTSCIYFKAAPLIITSLTTLLGSCSDVWSFIYRCWLLALTWGLFRFSVPCPRGWSLLVFHLRGLFDGNNLCNAISSLSRLIKTHIYKSASNYYTQKHLVPLTNFRQKRLCLPC